MSSVSQSDKIYNARHYALGILVVVYTFNFIDRQILSILLEPVKADLGLSDTAMGMLTGFAFAMFYATLGIPIARYADRSKSPQSHCAGFRHLEFLHRPIGCGAKFLAFAGCTHRGRGWRGRLFATRPFDDCRLLSG